MKVKLSQWAKENGVHYQTALKYFHRGDIKGAYQAATGSIFVDTGETSVTSDSPSSEFNVAYARVSSHDRKESLENQVDSILQFATARGIQVHKIYKEVASGMNDDRRELWKMIDNKPTTIIVENKDRLTRFDYNYLDRLLGRSGTQILVMHPTSDEERDIMQDFISVITSFCCRLYGARRGRKKKNELIRELESGKES